MMCLLYGLKSKWPPMTNFHFFINDCYYGTYETGIFAKLADKGLLGCRQVVGADA